MDDANIRLGCLQLATELTKRTGEHSVDGVVQIATLLYTFIQTPPAGETRPEIADKPRSSKRSTKMADLLD